MLNVTDLHTIHDTVLIWTTQTVNHIAKWWCNKCIPFLKWNALISRLWRIQSNKTYRWPKFKKSLWTTENFPNIILELFSNLKEIKKIQIKMKQNIIIIIIKNYSLVKLKFIFKKFQKHIKGGNYNSTKYFMGG